MTAVLAAAPAAPQVRTALSITVLVPAHNEEVTIAATLASLAAQFRAPDRVVVIADNCTDRTVAIARAAGADVLETVHNRDKKAGGLNQAFARLLPAMAPDDLVLVMDADTTLSGGFLRAAEAALAADVRLGAVGGLFYGDPGGGLVGEFQRNEYHRYQRETVLKGGRPMVLTGTASLFRAAALRAVAQHRGTLLPGRQGQVYDTLALTEDNELTIALKTLGWPSVAPQECTVSTEVMPDWRALWRQRERWQRGALENLRVYGWTPVTRQYWRQQFGLAYGLIALWSFLALMVLTVLASAAYAWSPFWAAITLVFVVERVSTVWQRGPRARLLAALLVPEIVYDTFLQLVFVKTLGDFALRRGTDWNYVPREA
jgi:cellulose synthase/poly-beta-1,6-N-acetylglucosamine synthase-like glycosyltransferase